MTPADDDEADEEPDALALWDGDGAVRLLRHDRARRALLLERARPGHGHLQSARGRGDGDRGRRRERLWRPAGEPFRWIGDHVPRWLDQAERSEQEGRDLIPLARELYASLDVGRDVLVHGDFHHHNILRARATGISRSTRKRCSASRSSTSLRSCATRSRYTMRADVTAGGCAPSPTAGLDEERMRKWAVIRCAYLGADAEEGRVLRSLV